MRMSSKKQVYYNIDEIRSKGCTYNLIFGEKSNGKSYQVKLKIMLENYLKTGRRFMLMRRWDADIKNNWIESYFSNMDIESLTNKKYNTIIKYRNEILFANNIIDKEGSIKTKKGEKCGYAIPLSLEQHYSSADFTDCDDIILEEFMERGSYLPNEVAKFTAFYSTVDRKRGTTRVWLIGNTVTKANPYIYEWGLQSKINAMKQGDIITLSLPNSEGEPITMAIEYCKSSGGKSMAIGSSSGMIDKGYWQSSPQPHLPKSKKCYNILFRLGFQFQGFKFLGELVADKENSSNWGWFIYPYYREFDKKLHVISDKVDISPYWHRSLDFKTRNEKLRKVLDRFTEERLFYSDDLTGTDFKQVIDFIIRR